MSKRTEREGEGSSEESVVEEKTQRIASDVEEEEVPLACLWASVEEEGVLAPATQAPRDDVDIDKLRTKQLADTLMKLEEAEEDKQRLKARLKVKKAILKERTGQLNDMDNQLDDLTMELDKAMHALEELDELKKKITQLEANNVQLHLQLGAISRCPAVPPLALQFADFDSTKDGKLELYELAHKSHASPIVFEYITRLDIDDEKN